MGRTGDGRGERLHPPRSKASGQGRAGAALPQAQADGDSGFIKAEMPRVRSVCVAQLFMRGDSSDDDEDEVREGGSRSEPVRSQREWAHRRRGTMRQARRLREL